MQGHYGPVLESLPFLLKFPSFCWLSPLVWSFWFSFGVFFCSQFPWCLCPQWPLRAVLPPAITAAVSAASCQVGATSSRLRLLPVNRSAAAFKVCCHLVALHLPKLHNSHHIFCGDELWWKVLSGCRNVLSPRFSPAVVSLALGLCLGLRLHGNELFPCFSPPLYLLTQGTQSSTGNDQMGLNLLGCH